MKRELFIHIGLHKTGTTALQEDYFPLLEGASFFRGWTPYRALFKGALEHKVIISDEGISGMPWGGRYLAEFHENMGRLQTLHGDPAIIVGVRRQDAFILSVYRQYLHTGGHLEPDHVFSPSDTGLIKRDELLWAPRLEFLRANFTRVYAYCQETLAADPAKVITGLSTFIGAQSRAPVQLKRSNEGVRTTLQVDVLRRLNRASIVAQGLGVSRGLYAAPLRRLGLTPRHLTQDGMKGLRGPAYSLRPDLRDFLQGHYETDWKHTQRLLDA